MAGIPVSKKGGIEPHLMFCFRCGGEYNGITVGVVMEATLSNGQKTYYNRGEKAKMVRGLPEGLCVKSTRHVEEGERVPSSEPCDKCQAELESHAEAVAAGGVYFQCEECGGSGVIKKSEFADNVRAHTGIKAPHPVGIAFSKCEEHATA